MSIDTACSSSLVALVQGCRGVERGEAPMALCCGVNAMFDGNVFLVLSNAGMLSPDGRCKTFDASGERVRTRRGMRSAGGARLEERRRG
jgi:phthiocerol/phenolphthiocerol synthesis type-I polyketide synthase C